MSDERIYKIVFNHQGEVIELYARSVTQSNLFGFIEIADLVFGARSTLVVDPSEDALKREFDGVERIHVPMHAVVRIDEVKHAGAARVRAGKEQSSNILRAFPIPMPGPGPSKR